MRHCHGMVHAKEGPHQIIDMTVTPSRRYNLSQIVQWWRDGRTVSQIARELDCSWLLVQKGIQYFLRKGFKL